MAIDFVNRGDQILATKMNEVIDGVNVASAYAAVALPKTGGTMIGNLVLNADPTNSLGAATKQYVDNKKLDMPTIFDYSTYRALNTFYRNETDKVKFVAVCLTADSGVTNKTATVKYSFYNDASTALDLLMFPITGACSGGCTFLVPPKHYYGIYADSGVSVHTWNETSLS